MSALSELAAKHAPRAPAGLVLARTRDGITEVATTGPVTAEAVFELGSITKVVTGMLLADAVVRGEVELTSTLDEFLPGARPLRLGDLASHTAGVPRLPWALLRRGGVFNLDDPYRGTTVDELVADLAGVRLRRPRLRYSNFGFALLGQALAARAGEPYEALAEQRILRPLGIEELWLRDAPAVAQPHARRGRRPVAAWTMDAYAPCGCLRGTVRGALALAAACLDPPPALADAIALALTVRAGREPVKIGLGWLRLSVKNGAPIWWHNGGTHGSRAFCAFVPDTGDTFAAVTNSTKAPDNAARNALVR